MQLESTADSQYVSPQARWLCDNPAMINTYVGQLLLHEELERVKTLRCHSEFLNKSALTDKKDCKNFVFMPEKIMYGDESGKLALY